MALALYDRVQQTGTANTTVSFTLSGSVTGFQSFAVVGNTNTTYYSAFDASGNWETGLGTYSTTGPILTRTTIYQSSNSNAAVTFSGSVNVFVTYPSGRSVNLDASGNASALGTVASGTWQGTVITPTYGGTGVAGTLTGLLYGNGASAQTVATTAQALTLIGTVPIANGGTNSTATATAGGAGYGTGTAHAYTAAGTSGQPLISAGAAAPAFGTLALGTANTNVSGALTATNGGTGVATLTGIAKGNGTSAFTAATSGTDYSAGTSALSTGILKSTTTTGALTIAVAADFPTLNQSTTGNAATVTNTTTTSASTFYPMFSAANTSSNQGTNTNASLSYVPSTGVLTATSMVSSSDERLKTNWAGLNVDFVSRLADVKSGTYERISSGNRETGVTAQSLKKLLPEAVIEGEDGMLSVNYGAAALVAAIELAKEVKALRAEIEELKRSK